MSHVTHMNGSYHTYKWVMSHIWMSHVTRMNGSCHTWWVMSHIWMSHVTHMHESCHTHESVTSPKWVHQLQPSTASHVWHDSFIRVTWLIHTCDMTHSYVWHNHRLLKPRPVDASHFKWHDSFIRVTWLIQLQPSTASTSRSRRLALKTRRYWKRREQQVRRGISVINQHRSVQGKTNSHSRYRLERCHGSWPCFRSSTVYFPTFF